MSMFFTQGPTRGFRVMMALPGTHLVCRDNRPFRFCHRRKWSHLQIRRE
ncbi:unnamed protein product [Larinioides sclopetarius]|uniref:Uncharacterized protein n=1 Tax=Larinioides sclopetarius TaxID=280406 RepID=A0AAV2BTX2_9ARAC